MDILVIKEKIKELLDLTDTTEYDQKLEILIQGAIGKLDGEGISKEVYDIEKHRDNYVVCLAYQVAMDLDLDLDLSKMEKLYIPRVITLRSVI